MRTTLKRFLLTASLVAIAGLVALACENSQPLGPEGNGPLFQLTSDSPFGVTGTGTIQSPPNQRYQQAFGIDIADQNLDGVPEGKLVFEDKNPANRLNSKTLKLRSVSWTSIVAISGCVDAGIEARGMLVVTNTNEQQRFRVIACDNGEPGSGRDVFSL
ncbi:MAG TPA: hypothetical protein VGQ29_08265, partial [Gemmatimonadales bacterium]|nr:hypothetical protein [Gemmatimonadales bacterium]